MKTLVSFIVVLGVLIFVHELGHFLFAKLFRVKVLKFSLGFGPKLIGRVFGETEYLISAVPLGGYVKMLGEHPEDKPAGDEAGRSFAGKPVWQRFGIVLAGPLFNLLFSVVLFFGIFAIMGLPESQESTTIGKVTVDSPAEQAGFAVSDKIVAIDGAAVTRWLDVLTAVKDSEGKALSVTVQRAGETLALTVVPKLDDVKDLFGEVQEQRYMIGIVKEDTVVYRSAGIIEYFKAAVWQTWMFIYLTFMGIVKIIQKVIPASELGGPILIAQLAGEQAREGLLNLAHFMGLLSVNLGILNLLPIPVLDGGHLVFLTVEGIRRKPMSERLQVIAQQVGIALLGTLMVFVFYNDIVRLISG